MPLSEAVGRPASWTFCGLAFSAPAQKLPEAVPGQEMPPQATTGRAILQLGSAFKTRAIIKGVRILQTKLRQKGVVTFALALSPADRIQPSYKGPLGKQYLDYIAAWHF